LVFWITECRPGLRGGKATDWETTWGRVLIIDDDPAVVRLVRLVLISDGITVESAESGEQGMLYLSDGNPVPDLILLDLAMPGMGGKEFFREARRAGYEGPVLFCSAYGAVAANQELGGQGAVEKPFDPEDLLAFVQRLIGPR
jgi:DNA-binding response OmpR family regulator